MYLASFAGLVKTILIIVLVYFGVKFLFRLFKPLILKYIMKKMGEKVGQSFQGFRPPNQQKNNEPEIDSTPKNSRKKKKPVGEYIEYEEID